MKKTLFFIIISFACLNAYCQKKYSDIKFVGKTFTIDTSSLDKTSIVSLIYDFPDANANNKLPRLVNQAIDSYHTDYESLVGEKFKCTEAKTFDSNQKFYLKLYNKKLGTFYAVSANGYYYKPRVGDLNCVEDERAMDTKGFKRLDSLSLLYLNKTFWVKSKEQNTYDAQNDIYDNAGTSSLRFKPVTVQKFTLSDNKFNPYRVFAKTPGGQMIYFDFELEKGARYGEMAMHNVNGRNIFEPRNRLSDGFFMKNPALTPSLIIAIKKGNIYIGMSAKTVELIKGKPDDINRTTNAYGVREQWVYRSQGEYYYFDNGKLTSVQN